MCVTRHDLSGVSLINTLETQHLVLYMYDTWTIHHCAGVKLCFCSIAQCAAILGMRIIAGSVTCRRSFGTRYVTGRPRTPWRPHSVNFVEYLYNIKQHDHSKICQYTGLSE